MEHSKEWQIEWTLWRSYGPGPAIDRAEAVCRVMRMIRESFIPRAEVAATIEKLRIPDMPETSNEEDDRSDQIAFGYNKALDTVKVSLISGVAATSEGAESTASATGAAADGLRLAQRVLADS